jgi:hypothetical protein
LGKNAVPTRIFLRVDLRQYAFRAFLFSYPHGSVSRIGGNMTDIFFMVCRLMAAVGVGTIIVILGGIAMGKIEV